MLTAILAALSSTAMRGFVVSLVGIGALALKSKLGIDLDATAQASIAAIVMGYLAKLGHENHLAADSEAIGAQPAPVGQVNPADAR
jgi:hypothetical protein